MNEQIMNIILSDTFTLTQLKARIRALKSYLLNSFFTSSDQTETNFSAEELKWLKSLPPVFFQNFTKDNIYDIFTELQRLITQQKVLIIYLSFEPDETTTNHIGTYARKNFGQSLLLDMKFDPGLIAGAALSWNGIYKDYSLHSKIEQKKGEILESFKKFLR